jgi:hypothetical protein
MLRFDFGPCLGVLGALGLVAVSIAASCSANGVATSLATSGGQGGGRQAGAGGSEGTAQGGGGSSGIGLVTATSGPGASGTTGAGGSAACAADPYQAQQLPLDMYVMQDQSGSMSDTVSGGGTKWQAVTGAFQAFVTQPGLTGISMGLQYFGLPPGGGQTCGGPTCATDADCGSAACGPCMLIVPGFGICSGSSGGGDSCNAADYATPEVAIAPLPGNAQAIITSLGMHMPSTSTPTQPALQGAVDGAKAWAMTHPGHVVIAVLATDGEPTECAVQDQAGIAAISAAALAGTPSIKTFTIGIFAPADIPSGPDLLNAVAAAGGTGQAFVINTANQNTNMQFLAALNAIRGSALGCQYTIPKPEAGTADYGKVNVQYTPGGGGMPTEFNHYDSASQCPPSGDGWYYDNNNAPTQILLCPSTCNTVSADSTGKIEILLGCKTKQPA